MHKKNKYNILFRRSMSYPFKKILQSVMMSMNNQIFKKRITLKYFLYAYLCYFWHTKIFGYLFGKYVASKYIQIFVQYIMCHPNIFGYLFVSIL